jgi:hypothetical protein
VDKPTWNDVASQHNDRQGMHAAATYIEHLVKVETKAGIRASAIFIGKLVFFVESIQVSL